MNVTEAGDWLALFTILSGIVFVGAVLWLGTRGLLGQWKAPRDETRIDIDYKHIDARRAWDSKLGGRTR